MYLSGMGMTAFTLLAAVLLHKTEKLNDAKSFLIFEPTNSTLVEHVGAAEGNTKEILLLVCILGYVCFSSIGVLIIPWILISEVYPIEVRIFPRKENPVYNNFPFIFQVKGKLGGLTITIAYLLMFCVIKIFPYTINWFSMQGILLIFSLNSFICCIYVYLCLPETYGKNFSEIENFFINNR
jgi:hypothetical protein